MRQDYRTAFGLHTVQEKHLENATVNFFFDDTAFVRWTELLSPSLSHHSEHAEARLAKYVAQVSDSCVRRHPGRKASLSLRLSQLQGAAQFVQAFPAHHGSDEHAVWL